ncbi:MAG: HAD family hydrolase [Bacteroidales bacterium]|nr:HAD family hydrolase [Bacteroidales bacterium]
MKEVVVIFDLDGTLIDTIGDLSAAVEYALSQGGFPGHTVEEYRRMVGHGIRNLVTRALPEGTSEETIDLTLGRFVDYYTSHIDVLSRPYHGIHELLRNLSACGVRLAVASNKFQEGTQALIHRFFEDIPFVKILGNAPGLPLKPDPAVVRIAMEAASAGTPPDLGRVHSRFAEAEYGRWPVVCQQIGPLAMPAVSLPDVKAVMVGDSATDIKTARNAGIPAVAVSWGFRPRTDLEAADAIADTPEQLLEIIRIFTGKN